MKFSIIATLVLIIAMLAYISNQCYSSTKNTVRLEPYQLTRKCREMQKFDNITYYYPNKVLYLSDKICIDDAIISLITDSIIYKDIDHYKILTDLFYMVNKQILSNEIFVDFSIKNKNVMLLFSSAHKIYFSTRPYILKDFSRIDCVYKLMSKADQIRKKNSNRLDIHIIVEQCNLYGKKCSFRVEPWFYRLEEREMLAENNNE